MTYLTQCTGRTLYRTLPLVASQHFMQGHHDGTEVLIKSYILLGETVQGPTSSIPLVYAKAHELVGSGKKTTDMIQVVPYACEMEL